MPGSRGPAPPQQLNTTVKASMLVPRGACCLLCTPLAPFPPARCSTLAPLCVLSCGGPACPCAPRSLLPTPTACCRCCPPSLVRCLPRSHVGCHCLPRQPHAVCIQCLLPCGRTPPPDPCTAHCCTYACGPAGGDRRPLLPPGNPEVPASPARLCTLATHKHRPRSTTHQKGGFCQGTHPLPLCSAYQGQQDCCMACICLHSPPRPCLPAFAGQEVSGMAARV